MAPREYRIIDKDELHRKFVDEGWGTRLATFPEDLPQLFGRKTLRIWRDPDGDVKCRKLEYNNPTGRSDVIRQLLDDDGIMWYIP